jgi:ornithine decarboxylase
VPISPSASGQPVTLLRPHAARRAARFFVEKFPGRSLYAVKANPSPDLLRILWDGGVTHYDVASIGEVRLVARRCRRRCCASCTR